MNFSSSTRAEYQSRQHIEHVAAQAIAAATTALGKPLPANVQRRIVKALETLHPDLVAANVARDAAFAIDYSGGSVGTCGAAQAD